MLISIWLNFIWSFLDLLWCQGKMATVEMWQQIDCSEESTGLACPNEYLDHFKKQLYKVLDEHLGYLPLNVDLKVLPLKHIGTVWLWTNRMSNPEAHSWFEVMSLPASYNCRYQGFAIDGIKRIKQQQQKNNRFRLAILQWLHLQVQRLNRCVRCNSWWDSLQVFLSTLQKSLQLSFKTE